MLIKKISLPVGGRRWVVADVHGCARTLETLVRDKIRLTKQDQLFLLGDYIDRGKNSAGVLDFLIDLQEKGYQVHPVRGNHEQEFMENYNFYVEDPYLATSVFYENCLANGTERLLDATGRVRAKYWNFLTHLPFYIVLDDYFLVHAGFDFSKADAFHAYKEMIWIRRFSEVEVDFKVTANRRIVVGHSLHALDDIKSFIERRHIILPLDNGCFVSIMPFAEKYAGIYGNLCALDLDEFELIVQPCID